MYQSPKQSLQKEEIQTAKYLRFTEVKRNFIFITDKKIIKSDNDEC